MVAVDKTTGAFRTFQELTNRAKKDVQMEDVKVLVGVFAFDLMLLNGEVSETRPGIDGCLCLPELLFVQPLLNESLRVRRHLMRTLLPPLSPSALETDSLIARFDHVQSTDSTDPAEVQSFFQDCVTSKAEGIMVKLLDSIGVQGSDGFEEEESAKGKKAIIFEQEEVDEDVAEENADDAEEDADEADAIKGPPKSPTKKGRKKDLPATYQPGACLLLHYFCRILLTDTWPLFLIRCTLPRLAQSEKRLHQRRDRRLARSRAHRRLGMQAPSTPLLSVIGSCALHLTAWEWKESLLVVSHPAGLRT